MMPDDASAQDAVQATVAANEQAAETMRSTATDVVDQVETATDHVAMAAQTANQDGAEAVATASRAGSDAIGEVRDRLNAMASALPGPAQEMLRPFQASGGAVGKGMEASYSTAMEGMAEFNSKAIAAWRNNAESTIRHWQSLVAVKSLSEAIALSAEHTRQQLEAVTSQTRELSTLATRIVRDAANPLKLTAR